MTTANFCPFSSHPARGKGNHGSAGTRGVGFDVTASFGSRPWRSDSTCNCGGDSGGAVQAVIISTAPTETSHASLPITRRYAPAPQECMHSGELLSFWLASARRRGFSRYFSSAASAARSPAADRLRYTPLERPCGTARSRSTIMKKREQQDCTVLPC